MGTWFCQIFNVCSALPLSQIKRPVSGLGLVLGSIMVAASLLGLVWLFHFGREPMLGWYQPWNHSFWIVAERRGSHSWQRLVNGAT